jgi:hypothetical protein
MEKNLPFITIGIADSNYNNRVLPFLTGVDDGKVFKWYLTTFWRLAAFALLLGGLAISFMELFGDSGFIKQAFDSEFITGGKKAGAAVGLVLGLVLSIVTAWFLYSVTKKRAEQLNDQEYKSLLHFVFVTMIPRLITLIGELSFTYVMYIGLLQLVATLVGSLAYAPLLSYGLVLTTVPGVDMIANMLPNTILPNTIYCDYDNFSGGIQLALVGIVGSVLILSAYYIYREIYNYALKLVMALISFLPKFAIPLAIRNKSEN